MDFEHELIDTELVNSTPSTIFEVSKTTINSPELTNALATMRVTMIQNLLGLSEDIYIKAKETDNLADKITLARDIRGLYGEINKLAADVEESITVNEIRGARQTVISRKDAPYLDFDARKRRSQVWRDYIAWCSMTGAIAMNKGEFFKLVLKSKFKESTSDGYPVFIPPRVRQHK